MGFERVKTVTVKTILFEVYEKFDVISYRIKFLNFIIISRMSVNTTRTTQCVTNNEGTVCWCLESLRVLTFQCEDHVKQQ